MRLKMLINVSCCMLFIATFLLTSCSTKQRAINDLRKFSYELRDNSTYYDVGKMILIGLQNYARKLGNMNILLRNTASSDR